MMSGAKKKWQVYCCGDEPGVSETKYCGQGVSCLTVCGEGVPLFDDESYYFLYIFVGDGDDDDVHQIGRSGPD